jgi:hypothetical protein
MTPGPGNLPPRGRQPGPAAGRPPAVRDLLAAHAAARQQTADDHMFTFTINGTRVGTFRLQLFTAPATRPVAVAVQYFPGEGDPLGTWAEEYASEVWRREFPDSAEPPVWISLRLDPRRPDAPPEQITLVTFRADTEHGLSSPQRYPITDADVAALVGMPVSRDRGEGYQPWPRPPEPDWRVAWTILLPRPEGMNRGCFTTAPSWWRRLARQLIPRRAPRDCCYYHRVDWHQVNAAAIRVTRQARREGLASRALGHRAAELAEDQDLPAQEQKALVALFTGDNTIRPTRLLRRRPGYENGRHRITAMFDSGVRRTVVERLQRG